MRIEGKESARSNLRDLGGEIVSEITTLLIRHM